MIWFFLLPLGVQSLKMQDSESDWRTCPVTFRDNCLTSGVLQCPLTWRGAPWGYVSFLPRLADYGVSYTSALTWPNSNDAVWNKVVLTNRTKVWLIRQTRWSRNIFNSMQMNLPTSGWTLATSDPPNETLLSDAGGGDFSELWYRWYEPGTYGRWAPHTFFNSDAYYLFEVEGVKPTQTPSWGCTRIDPPPQFTGGYTVGRAGGDPHMMNIKGEKFNIAREGYAPLVKIGSDASADLEVMALIESIGAQSCRKKMFITRINASGNFLGEQIAVHLPEQTDNLVFHVTIGGKPLWSPMLSESPPKEPQEIFTKDELSIKTLSTHGEKQIGVQIKTSHDLNLKIVRPLHRAHTTPHLNFEIEGLKNMPNSWQIGGLLGRDAHSYWSTRDPGCLDSKRFSRVAEAADVDVEPMAIAY